MFDFETGSLKQDLTGQIAMDTYGYMVQHLKMDRRLFLIFSSASILSLDWFFKRNQPLKIKFSFNLKKHQMTAAEFCNLRSAYENDTKISLLNKVYAENGWLLSLDHKESLEEVEWTYTFKDAATFSQWENTLYSKGFVKKEGRPYHIERHYNLMS